LDGSVELQDIAPDPIEIEMQGTRCRGGKTIRLDSQELAEVGQVPAKVVEGLFVTAIRPEQGGEPDTFYRAILVEGEQSQYPLPCL